MSRPLPPRSGKTKTPKKRPAEALHWLFEPLMDQADYFERPMFGCLAAYLSGRLVLVLAAGDEPWNGLLMPTEKEYHVSILQDFIGTVQHPVLKKWLYLPETAEDFETVAAGIVEAVLNNDPRLGVEPKERLEKKIVRKKTS